MGFVEMHSNPLPSDTPRRSPGFLSAQILLQKRGENGIGIFFKRDEDIYKSLSTNKLILIAPCAILSSRKNNGGKHGNDKAENMGNNG